MKLVCAQPRVSDSGHSALDTGMLFRVSCLWAPLSSSSLYFQLRLQSLKFASVLFSPYQSPSAYLPHYICLYCGQPPKSAGNQLVGGTPTEPVSVAVTKKYFLAIQAWHLAQGWHFLSEEQLNRIQWSLQSIDKPRHHRPPLPLITLTC